MNLPENRLDGTSLPKAESHAIVLRSMFPEDFHGRLRTLLGNDVDSTFLLLQLRRNGIDPVTVSDENIVRYCRTESTMFGPHFLPDERGA